MDRIETRQAQVLPQLVFGLLTLVILASAYVITKQHELNEVRAFIISNYSDSALVRETLPRDPLTGVTDRRALSEVLNLETTRANRYRSTVGLVLLDIRGFSKINETEGNLAGDLVLKDLAGTLNSTVRKTDIVTRYGPDQFLCFLPGTEQRGAETFLRRLEKARLQSARLRGLTLDHGLTVYRKGDQPDALLAGLERELKAKRAPTALATDSLQQPA